MPAMDYEQRRSEIETYFDRTAADAWSRLTSDAPVSRIRATVRAGRDQMRGMLLDWLPQDLSGRRLLDAGCGTGALTVEAARRGAEVVAVDLSPTLVKLAGERLPDDVDPERVTFLVGDMTGLSLGEFHHVVAMDSLIHYEVEDGIRMIERLAGSVSDSMLFTFAPRTPLLATMHAMGRIFPRGNRAPAIEPVAPDALVRRLQQSPELADWTPGRGERVSSGFYTSQACELVRR